MEFLISILAVLVVAIVLAAAHLRLRRRVAALEQRLLESQVSPQATGTALPPAPPSVPSPLPVEEDWEAVIGGNWLNRMGALVLVVGIALFLGYSLTRLGPAGKIAIGFAAGASMLASGIALRKDTRYGSLALSLVGGGWAAIYFTAYSAHALEASRLITSALAGGFLLVTVSSAMVLHAIWYKSELGTALAFVFAFVTLNVTPLTGFSVFAGVLLAVSILALAYLQRWFRLAVAGVFLAYATFLLRAGAPEDLSKVGLWTQWLAFEGFDLADLRRRGFRRGMERSLFLINACGFFGVSVLYGWHQSTGFLVLASAAYLASTLLRARFEVEESELRPRLLGGGYEAALAISAVWMAAALHQRFDGLSLTIALLVLGEMIAVAGRSIANSFVRALGGWVLLLVFVRVLVLEALPGKTARDWTPTAVLVAAIFCANRSMGSWLYTAGAGILLAAVAEAEVPREWLPFVLSSAGALALVAAIVRDWTDVRRLHPALAAAAFLAGVLATGSGARANVPVVLTVACFYANQFLVRWRPGTHAMAGYAGVLYSLLGTGLFTLLLFREVHGWLLTVALGLEGAALLVAGLFATERSLRVSGLALFLVCIGKAFLYDLRQLDTFSRILSFIALGLLLLGASWIYARFRERIKRLL